MLKLILIASIFISCTQFIQSTDSDYFVERIDSNANELNIFFSHNINGETHPCGCRNFPLGGIPQAYGLIKSTKEKSPTIYIDSGDTFFPLPIVPDAIRKSTKFTAMNIVTALDGMGLNFLTPGDQDFALGESFLIEVAKTSKFKFLISNSSKEMKIPHKKLGIIKSNKTTFFFIGITDPKLFQTGTRKLFINPEVAIKNQLAIIAKQSGHKKIILVSHSGMETDQSFASKFPELDWIIGAHFTVLFI